MILDTSLLDIVTDCIQAIYEWTYIVILGLFSFEDIDGSYFGALAPIAPLFFVTIAISFIFVCVKLIRKFIWGS
ncbi:MAG: hypothetical protein IJ424_07320 [Oscillospiraceae bacterium]|nr:hypothetical protein [Oscillospiraceae bacterium]